MDIPSTQIMAVMITVKVQIWLLHHQLCGPVQTIFHACSKREVLLSHSPRVVEPCILASLLYDHYSVNTARIGG